jgi:hypothetical protein
MSDPDQTGNTPSQADLFADHRPQPRKVMDFQAEARRRLEKVLAEAKAAEHMPWTQRELEKWQILFPQMAGWLPDDEAGQLCFEFAQEVERLSKAA